MILVVGATGQLGSIVVRNLLQQKRSVRILVRPGSDYEPLIKAGARAVFGDIKSPITLIDALRGVETLITTANSARRGGDDNVQNVDLIGNRHLVNSAKTVGVKHFIFVSAARADDKSHSPFLQAKKKTENHIIQSGMNYTIVAPEPIMEVWFNTFIAGPLKADRPVTVIGEGNRRHSYISIEDVAGFIISSVGNPAARNTRLLIGGPKAISWNDIIGTFEMTLRKRIPVIHDLPGTEIPGIPEGMLELLTGMETYDSMVDTAKLYKVFGLRQTSMEEAVVSYLSGLKLDRPIREK
ncbi:MAG TPA: SDR family oxidoreductase [Methanomassiliicoccales archaeon]|jgi:NADH dehydrogenase